MTSNSPVRRKAFEFPADWSSDTDSTGAVGLQSVTC